MRKIRIYQAGVYQPGDLFELTPEAGQHVGTVLRMQPGDELILFSGDNREFIAKIETVKKKHVCVLIQSVSDVDRESTLNIHLAQGISKGSRMELVMQKAVELGVARITPISSERCAVKLDNDRMVKRVQQWQSIVIAACEQSGRNRIPVVEQPIALDVYLNNVQASLKLVLDPKGAKSWREFTYEQRDIAILIGPEGGFSETEINAAKQHGFAALSLGPRILRTETAAITALSLLQAVGGDL